jgi:hypothetical protein
MPWTYTRDKCTPSCIANVSLMSEHFLSFHPHLHTHIFSLTLTMHLAYLPISQTQLHVRWQKNHKRTLSQSIAHNIQPRPI